MFDNCLYFNLNKFSRQVNRLWDEAYRPLNLSPAHAYTLQLILENPGMTSNQIAAKMDLTISTVTRFINSLYEKGLVERRKESPDKRESNIHPTQHGLLLHKKLTHISNELHHEIRAQLGHNNVCDLLLSINKLTNKL